MDTAEIGEPSAATPLTPIERRVLEMYPALVVITVALGTVSRVEAYWGHFGNWDWLFISGVLTFLVAFPLSLWLPGQTVDVLRQVRERGVVPATDSTREFETRLHMAANRQARVGAWVCVGVIEFLWLIAVGDTQVNWVIAVYGGFTGAMIEGFLAVPVGRFLGRTLVYGSIGRRLRTEGIQLHPVAEHPDGRAGLAPLGSLYLKMTMMITLIAAFLGAWVLLLPTVSVWRGWYIVLLVAVLAWEVPAILRPLWQFHVLLVEAKRALLYEAATDDDCRRIEAMPTWILGAPVRWSLVVINILLLMPDLLFLVELTADS